MTDEWIRKSDVRELIDHAFSYSYDSGFTLEQLAILKGNFQSACVSRRVSGIYDMDEMKPQNKPR
jgi:hypothetical protein